MFAGRALEGYRVISLDGDLVGLICGDSYTDSWGTYSLYDSKYTHQGPSGSYSFYWDSALRRGTDVRKYDPFKGIKDGQAILFR